MGDRQTDISHLLSIKNSSLHIYVSALLTSISTCLTPYIKGTSSYVCWRDSHCESACVQDSKLVSDLLLTLVFTVLQATLWLIKTKKVHYPNPALFPSLTSRTHIRQWWPPSLSPDNTWCGAQGRWEPRQSSRTGILTADLPAHAGSRPWAAAASGSVPGEGTLPQHRL